VAQLGQVESFYTIQHVRVHSNLLFDAAGPGQVIRARVVGAAAAICADAIEVLPIAPSLL
jgi:hypothetical protein